MKHILIADDEEAVTSLLKDMLSPKYLVTAVHCGRELFELATSCRDIYALIISDIAMPNWNGVESVEMIRGLGVTTPIILMSGYVDKGVTGVPFVSKPFTMVDMKAAITSALGEQNV